VNESLIDKITLVLGWILVGYLYLRFWDLFAMTYTHEPGRSEGLVLLTQSTLAFNMWVGEIVLGTLLPAVMLLNRRLRSSKLVRLLALILVVGGLVAYRWDTNMVGQLVVQNPALPESAPLYAQYTPSIVEIVSTAGILAFGALAITLGIKYLQLVKHPA
ncbi:MAG: hypothetical protein OEZ02_05770, partial [Anaerolineae bacterium]|nr:hypothetical protein [Anaerolineae bacterium]